MKLINVDDIKWQKGVFVNPRTNMPSPIIHKIATIEMLREWQEEVKAIPLDKVKQAKEEIHDLKKSDCPFNCGHIAIELAEEILDKLIAESKT